MEDVWLEDVGCVGVVHGVGLGMGWAWGWVGDTSGVCGVAAILFPGILIHPTFPSDTLWLSLDMVSVDVGY